jgi:hypothetical protein
MLSFKLNLSRAWHSLVPLDMFSESRGNEETSVAVLAQEAPLAGVPRQALDQQVLAAVRTREGPLARVLPRVQASGVGVRRGAVGSRPSPALFVCSPAKSGFSGERFARTMRTQVGLHLRAAKEMLLAGEYPAGSSSSHRCGTGPAARAFASVSALGRQS